MEPWADELSAVLDHLPSGIVVVDQQGRPVMSNRAARDLLGPASTGSESLIDVAIAAGLSDGSTGQLVRAESTPLARALAGSLVSAEEYTIRHPQSNGHSRRLCLSGIPLRDAGGNVTGAVSVITDLTTGASLEQELGERRRAEDAFQRSQQRLRLALDAGHMGTWDYDVRSDRIEWSAEMGSILGTPLKPLGGSLADCLAFVHPEDLPATEQAVRDALDRGPGLQVETRVVHTPTDKVRWLMAKGRVYRDEHGRALRITGIIMDITKRKAAEAARHSLAHGERLRALGEMASGIAHDLNQSLALITGYSDMVRQELSVAVPDLGRVREMVEITTRAALEGGQAMRGLLSFVRTEEALTETERVDISEMLRDVARLTAPRWRDAPRAEGRPIDLDVETEADCAIDGSPATLREAMTNLIFNAVDALPGGGAIHLRARHLGERIMVEIADTGTGIPLDVQARVFDPFFTTKGQRGTGLGLPQVLTIVERHAGVVEIESAPDQGTTFRLSFPRASASVVSSGQAAGKNTSASVRNIRILVVEDEQRLARMAGVVLAQRGHHVVVVASAEEALEHLEFERFDLVISDLGLGAGQTGWDLAEAVRARRPGTRFVLVTGWGAAIDPKEALARGVDEVIAKPYRIADLRQVADHVAGALGPD